MPASTVRKQVESTADEWLSVREAAKRLKIAPPTVLTRVIQGQLVATTFAGRAYISRASVERALGDGR
jgi:excisionase family DNA binding protein